MFFRLLPVQRNKFPCTDQDLYFFFLICSHADEGSNIRAYFFVLINLIPGIRASNTAGLVYFLLLSESFDLRD